MDNIIYFGGAYNEYVNEQTKRTVHGLPQSVNKIFQEFSHYIATIWVHQNEVPESAEALSNFDTTLLIPKYKAYIASGGKVETGRGLTLEETWLVSQIFQKEPLICLINNQQPPQPIDRITKKILLTPDQIIELLQKAFPVRLNSQHDIQGQIQRWGKLSPEYGILVFDGVSGHCLNLIGIDKNTLSFIYWDPWPEISLLCREQNAANVAAVPCSNSERFWLLTPDDLERVIYAVLLPQTQWTNLIGDAQSDASVKAEQLFRQIPHSSNAEQRFLAFFELCQTRGLLTAQGYNDLVHLYCTNRLFDQSSEGYDTLYYLVKMVIERREEGVDLKHLLNNTLRILAEPASIHQ